MSVSHLHHPSADSFIDNNPELAGSLVDGVQVYGAAHSKAFSSGYILVTCNDEEEICRQLLELEFPEEKIVHGLHNITYQGKLHITVQGRCSVIPSTYVSILWKEYIDKCLTISSLIEKKILSCGVEGEKLARLEWKVPCEEKLDRMYH